jgi:hypothetical protein
MALKPCLLLDLTEFLKVTTDLALIIRLATSFRFQKNKIPFLITLFLVTLNFSLIKNYYHE